jgi:hypothetical protein
MLGNPPTAAVRLSGRAANVDPDIASGSPRQQEGFTITLKNGPSVMIDGA